jgi:hypothetical protein
VKVVIADCLTENDIEGLGNKYHVPVVTTDWALDALKRYAYQDVKNLMSGAQPTLS